MATVSNKFLPPILSAADTTMLNLALTDQGFLTNVQQLGLKFGFECCVVQTKFNPAPALSAIMADTDIFSCALETLPVSLPLYADRHQVAAVHIATGIHADRNQSDLSIRSILSGFRLAVQQQLTQQLDKLNLQHHAPPHDFGLWHWQLGNRNIVCSAQCLHLLSVSTAKQLPNSTVLNTRGVLHKIHPQDRKSLTTALRTLLSGQSSALDCEARFRHDDGDFIWLHHRAQIIAGKADANQRYIIGTSVNIQQRKTDHEQISDLCFQLQATEERYRHLMKYASDAIIIIDQSNGRIIDANNQAHNLSYYSLKELFQLKYTELLLPDEHDQGFETELCALKTGLNYDIQLRQKNGDYIAVDVGCTSLEMSGYKLMQCIIHDISEHKAIEEQLIKLANYDPLTALPNRLLFQDRLRQALLKSKRNNTLVALCFIDLDNFKRINDDNCHAAGDFVLIEVAKRIQQSLRASDTTARIGGDEFVAVLGEIDNHAAIKQVTNKLLEKIKQPIVFNDVTITVTCSIGISIYPTTTKDGDELIHYADTAMYNAKKMGNCLKFFAPDEKRRGEPSKR